MTRKSLKLLFVSTLIILVVFLFSACSGNDEATTDGDADNSTDGDTDNSTDGDTDNPVDGDTEDIADGDTDTELNTEKPLARDTTTLMEVAEPAWIIPGAIKGEDENLTGETGMILDDDGAENPGETLAKITEKFMTDHNGYLVDTKYGDFDGDDKLEMAVLSIYMGKEADNLRFRWPSVTIIDDKDAGFAVIGTISKDDLDFSSLNLDEESVIMADLEVGNIDDDTNSEIVLALSCGKISFTNNYESFSPKSSILVSIDDLKNNLTILNTDTETFANTKILQIDLGDFDSDDRDETVAIGVIDSSPKAWVLDDYSDQFTELYTWHKINDNYIFKDYTSNPNVTSGDFDGDGVDEILFGGLPTSACRFQTYVYDDAKHDFAYLEDKKFDDCGNISYNPIAIPKLEAGDITGDRADEAIIAIHDNYSGQNRSWRLFYLMVNSDDSEPIDMNATANDWNADRLNRLNPNYFHISVADTDRDMHDEVYTIYTDTQIGGQNPLDPTDSTTTYKYIGKKYKLNGSIMEKQDEWSWDIDEPKAGLVALGDIDNDSVVARYTGEHWLAMSEPRIIVAMAMPPAWKDIPQDNATFTYIGYGQVREQSVSESNEINVSAAVTMTAEGGDPFGIVEVKASASLKKEITKTTTQSKTFSTGVKHICGWTDEDLDNFVVFATTEYTRYQYEIISHENPEKVGSLFTIDVPGTTNVFKKTVTAFNEQNGDYPDIGEETFNHTVGDPETYPSVDDKNNMLDAENEGFTGWQSDIHTIGETSSGGTEIVISMSKEEATAEARTLGVEVSAGFSVGGVGTEVTAGLSETNIYEISVGETTEYVGSVGDIPSDYHADYSYEFGMFVYNFEREDGTKYQVINWFVK